jgi:GTP-binding protein
MLAPTANIHAILRSFQTLSTRHAGSSGSLRSISSSTNGSGKSVFKDAKSAEFIASVGDKESLPSLGGLPEVSYIDIHLPHNLNL